MVAVAAGIFNLMHHAYTKTCLVTGIMIVKKASGDAVDGRSVINFDTGVQRRMRKRSTPMPG